MTQLCSLKVIKKLVGEGGSLIHGQRLLVEKKLFAI